MKCWRTCTPIHRPHCLEQCATMLKQSPINSMRFALRPNAKALCESVLRAVSDKCLLRSIFGIISISQHSPYNPKHQRSVLVNQLSHRHHRLYRPGSCRLLMNHSSEVPQFARSYNRYSFCHKVHEFFTANISLQSSVHFRTPLYQNRTLYKTLNSDDFRNLL